MYLFGDMQTRARVGAVAVLALCMGTTACAPQMPEGRQRGGLDPEDRNLMMRNPISVDPAPATPKEPPRVERRADRMPLDARAFDRKAIEGRRDFATRTRERIVELDAKASRLKRDTNTTSVNYVNESAWRDYERRREEVEVSLPLIDEWANPAWMETSQRVTRALSAVEDTLKRIEDGR